MNAIPSPRDLVDAGRIGKPLHGCHTKTRFATEKEAEQALVYIRGIFPRPRNFPRSAYYCGLHVCWHLSKWAPGEWKHDSER